MKCFIPSFSRLFTCVMVICISGSVFAQNEEPPFGVVGDNLSEELREIRTRQLEVANANDVQLNIVNNGMRYATGIKNIPPELRNETITHERDLIPIIPELTKYLGFQESESLEFASKSSVGGSTSYAFLQLIDGIITPITLRVLVSNENFRVEQILGAPVLDTGFPKRPSTSRTEAFNLVEQHIREGNEPEGRYDLESDFTADVVFRTTGEHYSLEPWWIISVPLSRRGMPEGLNSEGFYVSPGGEVENVIDAHTVHVTDDV